MCQLADSVDVLSFAPLEEFPDRAEPVKISAGLTDQPFRQVLGAARNRVPSTVDPIEHDFAPSLSARPALALNAAPIVRVFVAQLCGARLLVIEPVEFQPMLNRLVCR